MRILCVFAHPDDESFGPAALLAKCAAAGDEIHAIYATRGEAGKTHLDPPPSPEELAALREADLGEAARLIGIGVVEQLERLTQRPQREATFFRAWPPVPEGEVVREIGSS